jgi:plastocyanin
MRIAIPFAILLVLVVMCCGCSTTPPSPPPSTGTPTSPLLATPTLTSASAAGTGEVVSIRIKENSFDPNIVTVRTGTTVVWTNEDPSAHTVTYTGTGTTKFDSGNLVKGQSFSNTFNTPGRYIYACTQHASMKGTIVVE